MGLRGQGQVLENSTEAVTPGRLGSGPSASWRGEEVRAGNIVLLALALKGSPISLGHCRDPWGVICDLPQQAGSPSDDKLAELLCRAAKADFDPSRDQCHIWLVPASDVQAVAIKEITVQSELGDKEGLSPSWGGNGAGVTVQEPWRRVTAGTPSVPYELNCQAISLPKARPETPLRGRRHSMCPCWGPVSVPSQITLS